jgi:hypothetical protein
MGEGGAGSGWSGAFDERQLKEIELDRLYASMYHHGTDGHNGRIIIARMAELLDEREERASQPAAPTEDTPGVRIDDLERVMSRLLTVVLRTMSEARSASESAQQAQARLEDALREEFGIERETLLALMSQESLRQMADQDPLGEPA